MMTFTKENLHLMEGFKNYRKRINTRAVRMPRPFRTETQHGTVTCADGYLAIDDDGYPYPIEKKVFESSYEEILQ